MVSFAVTMRRLSAVVGLHRVAAAAARGGARGRQNIRDEDHACRPSTRRNTSYAKISPPRSRRDSGGRIKAEIYPASQLGSIPRQIEGLQFGAIQAGVIPPEFFVGVDERFEVMAAPGLVDSMAHGLAPRGRSGGAEADARRSAPTKGCMASACSSTQPSSVDVANADPPSRRLQGQEDPGASPRNSRPRRSRASARRRWRCRSATCCRRCSKAPSDGALAGMTVYTPILNIRTQRNTSPRPSAADRVHHRRSQQEIGTIRCRPICSRSSTATAPAESIAIESAGDQPSMKARAKAGRAGGGRTDQLAGRTNRLSIDGDAGERRRATCRRPSPRYARPIRPSSPVRSAHARLAASDLTGSTRRISIRAAQVVGFAAANSARRKHEFASHARRAPCRQRPDPRRPDRRRQIRLDVSGAGADDRRHRGGGDRRSRSRARQGGVPQCRLGRGAHRAHAVRRARQRCLQRRARRGGDRGDRQSGRRHRARARSVRGAQAHRHGQCRSRRARRRVAGPQGARGGRDLFDGLWRSAGADCRDGRLGALGRLYRRSRRQGHQISAGLSHRHAGRRVGALRPHRRGSQSAPA